MVFCVFHLNVSFGWFILDGSATDDGNIIALSIVSAAAMVDELIQAVCELGCQCRIVLPIVPPP